MTSLEGCTLIMPAHESSDAGTSRLRAASPDEAALIALTTTYTSLLFRIAHSVLRNRTEAEDTVQDVFVRVLEHRHTLSSVRDMRVWLVRIAWNLALDRRRRIRPDQMDDRFTEGLCAANLPADEALAETRRIEHVLREMDRLPRPEREVLLLSAQDELGTAAIAEVLGRSESAVRALLFRARTRLRGRMEQPAKPPAGKGGRA